MKTASRSVLLAALSLAGSVRGFLPAPASPSAGLARLAAAADATPQPNEFSRPVSTDRILKTSGGKRRMNAQYQMDVTATRDECAALAERFGLPRLQNLTATLSIGRPPEEAGESYHYANGLTAVQVKGNVQARVTQTCVRTVEQFDTDVDVSLFSIVKPTATSKSQEDDQERQNILRELKRNNVKIPTTTEDIMDLQQLLANIADEDDIVVEDESVYSSNTGKLDVGELVAQTLWLSLDPYPKKPGTKPVTYTITG